MGLIAKALVVLALGAGAMQSARPPDHIGFAVRYDPGVMERRAAAHHAPLASCYVAYTLARDQDMARLWLRVEGPAGALDCLVVDLPDDSKGHRQPLIRRRVWVELGWPSRWICGKGWTGRAKDCKIKVWRLNMSRTSGKIKPTMRPIVAGQKLSGAQRRMLLKLPSVAKPVVHAGGRGKAR